MSASMYALVNSLSKGQRLAEDIIDSALWNKVQQAAGHSVFKEAADAAKQELELGMIRGASARDASRAVAGKLQVFDMCLGKLWSQGEAMDIPEGLDEVR
jgi:hypothetical protein